VKIEKRKEGNDKGKDKESQKENTEDPDDQEKEGNNDDKEQDKSQKQKCFYKKKIDIRQGEKDYTKWMGQLKMIKSKGSMEAINKLDQKLCSMIIKYQKNYRRMESMFHQK